MGNIGFTIAIFVIGITFGCIMYPSAKDLARYLKRRKEFKNSPENGPVCGVSKGTEEKNWISSDIRSIVGDRIKSALEGTNFSIRTVSNPAGTYGVFGLRNMKNLHEKYDIIDKKTLRKTGNRMYELEREELSKAFKGEVLGEDGQKYDVDIQHILSLQARIPRILLMFGDDSRPVFLETNDYDFRFSKNKNYYIVDFEKLGITPLFEQ